MKTWNGDGTPLVMKTCRLCGETKAEGQFSKRRGRARNICNGCNMSRAIAAKDADKKEVEDLRAELEQDPEFKDLMVLLGK